MPHLSLSCIDQSLPAVAQVFDSIKIAILRMQLPPGQMLSESYFAEQFGTSRTPVREALIKLRDAGLVTTRPSRGHFVTLLCEKSIREARFLREAIEVASVRQLCDNAMEDKTRIRLEQNLALQLDAAKEHNDLLFTELDDSFHRTIAEATGYERVVSALEREKLIQDRIRVLALGDQKHLMRLQSEHQEIFEAILNQDKRAAVDATRHHLQSVLNTLSSLMIRHKEYFEPPEEY